MNHFLLAVTDKELAPVGGNGDALSWLRYYKLNPDNSSAFIPMLPGLQDVKRGDTLWFALNEVLHSYVVVDEVQHDPINDRFEIWFSMQEARYVTTTTKTTLATQRVSNEVASDWLLCTVAT